MPGAIRLLKVLPAAVVATAVTACGAPGSDGAGSSTPAITAAVPSHSALPATDPVARAAALLGRGPTGIDAAWCATFTELGADVVPLLESRASEKIAVYALSAVVGPEADAALLRIAADAPIDQWALDALAEVAQRRVPGAVDVLLRRERDERALEEAHAADRHEPCHAASRPRLIEYLGLAAPDERAVARLVEMARDTAEERCDRLRLEAAKRRATSEGSPGMVAPHFEARLVALRALAAAGPLAADAVPGLLAIAGSTGERPEVRVEALRALGAMGKGGLRTAGLLVPLLAEHRAVRIGATPHDSAAPVPTSISGEALDALRHLTGADCGPGAARWRTFLSGTASACPAASAVESSEDLLARVRRHDDHYALRRVAVLGRGDLAPNVLPLLSDPLVFEEARATLRTLTRRDCGYALAKWHDVLAGRPPVFCATLGS